MPKIEAARSQGPTIHMRLKEEDHKALRTMAEAHGFDEVSTFLRTIIRKLLIKNGYINSRVAS